MNMQKIVLTLWMLALAPNINANTESTEPEYLLAKHILSAGVLEKNISSAFVEYQETLNASALPADMKESLLREFKEKFSGANQTSIREQLIAKFAEIYKANLSDEEMKQLLGMLESPLYNKWRSTQKLTLKAIIDVVSQK